MAERFRSHPANRIGFTLIRIRFQEPADEGFLAASDISGGLMSRGPAFRRGDEIPLHLSYRSQSKVIPELKPRKRISLTGLYGIFKRVKK